MEREELKKKAALAIFDSSPCLAAVIDSQCRIELSNAAFARAFGRQEGEPCHEVYKRRATRCEKCPVDQVFATGKEQVTDEHGVDQYNREIRYRLHAIPLFDDAGKVTHVLQVSTDHTRLTELEQGLKQAERLANVGMTAAGLAHTIKNILGGLEGGTYMVESAIEKENRDRLKAGWEMVQKYIEQLTGLVQNLLSYSKPRPPSREPIDPRDLVRDVVRLHDEKAHQAGVEIRGETGRDLQPLSMDREAMHASLTNLVSNALDACTWDPDIDKEHRITVSARSRPGGGVRFEVSDNGTGISEENQCKILSAFFTTKGIRGTGLGLLMTKRTVHEHNGTIEFTSRPGEGTTFRIELPRDTGEPGEAPDAAPGEG
jgi:signal transduction histidine kinase